MSGELLSGVPYNSAMIINDDGRSYVGYIVIMQTFYHDLESIFWILIWLCLSKCKGGLPRPALASREDNARIVGEVRWLFRDASRIARYKRVAMTLMQELRYTLALVDDFWAPLVPFLESFCSILGEGYRTHVFDFERTFDALEGALGEAENRLLQES